MFTVPVPENKLNQTTRLRIKEGIYLLGYLIHKANWESGNVLTTFEKIEREAGFPERTARRWLEMLVDAGEIKMQRVKQGTLVTILDFEAVARTRNKTHKKRHLPRTPAHSIRDPESNRPHVATSDRGKWPKLAQEVAESGHMKWPNMAREVARSGHLNNNKNMYKTEVQNLVQNRDSLTVVLKGALASTRPVATKPEDLKPGDKERLKSESAARLKIAGMDGDELEKLATAAMEEMACDERPHMSTFIRRGESGKLEPANMMGAAMVVRAMVRRIAGEKEEPGSG